MTDDDKKLIVQPAFVSALSYAKALANKLQLSMLTPGLMLAGFVPLVAKTKEDKSLDFLEQKAEDIRSTLSDISLTVPEDLQPKYDIKLPLSDDLKKLVAGATSEVDIFVDSLIGQLRASKILDTPLFNQIIAYGSHIATTRHEQQISPEIFTASAFIAFRQGALQVNSSLSGYFLSNKNVFDALISELAIDYDIKPRLNQEILHISDEIVSVMRDMESNQERVFAALNVGLKSGFKIISRIATAYHEAGHAVVSAILKPSISVVGVSIVAKDDYDGLTSFDSNNPNSYFRKSTTVDDLQIELAVDLAGRAAQLIKFGPNQIDQGASSDIESATYQAWRNFALFGLDHEIGPVNLEVIGKLQGQHSGQLFDLVQMRVQYTLKEAADRAEALLRANWDQVESVTKLLLEKKDLTDNDFILGFASNNISFHIDAINAQSIPIDRDVIFATINGIMQTPEGPVRYNVGDALVSDANGHQWPVGRAYFEKHYVANMGTFPGTDGRYTKAPQDVKALQLKDNRRLDLSGGRGILLGKRGDWIVEYGDGELSIVGQEQFSMLYKLMN